MYVHYHKDVYVSLSHENTAMKQVYLRAHIFLSLAMKIFNKNGEKTIDAYDPHLTEQISLRPDLSFYDVFTVNQLYSCSGRLLPTTFKPRMR